MTAFKRFTVLFLAMLFVFGAIACSDGESETSKDDASTEESKDDASADASKDEVSADASKDEVSADTSKDDASTETSKEESEESKEDGAMYEPLNYDDMKGIWLYQYRGECIFRTGGDQRDEADFRVKVEQVCSNLARDGYNTLFLQVRPYGDSFYPSEFYCPTNFVVQDYTDTFDYDPLAIFVEYAHKYNVSIHAWLNPMRLMTPKQIVTVPENYKISQWFKEKNGDYLSLIDGRYYLNPAYAETRQLIIDGAMEICKNYDIDGIHFDDYFYVSIQNSQQDLAFDQIAYDAQNPGGAQTLSARKAWRKQNVNTLLRDLFSTIKEYDERIMFGVSPAGNIDNNVNGYLCADIYTWCSEPGYIDYIAPQVYWSFDYKANFAKFDICTISWAKLMKCEDVKLIIGIGLYRTERPSNNQTDPGWFNKKDNIKRMLEFLDGFKNDSGWIMFDYETLYDINTGEYNPLIVQERENFLPLMKPAAE